MRGQWVEWKLKIGWTVAQCKSEWALGSGYKFARNKYGLVQRFWTKKAAVAEAERRNRIISILR